MGSALALSKIKKQIALKSEPLRALRALTEAVFLWNKFAPRGKIFSNLGCALVWGELPRRSSLNKFFVATPKNTETD